MWDITRTLGLELDTDLFRGVMFVFPSLLRSHDYASGHMLPVYKFCLIAPASASSTSFPFTLYQDLLFFSLCVVANDVGPG